MAYQGVSLTGAARGRMIRTGLVQSGGTANATINPLSQCRSGVAGPARAPMRGPSRWLVPGRQSGQCRRPRSDDGTAATVPWRYIYNIGTYDVTNSQYVEFLNAKDPTGANPLGLYNSNMSNATFGGINFNAGNANGSKYSVISGDGNHPVNYVTWYDAHSLRQLAEQWPGQRRYGDAGPTRSWAARPRRATATASRGTPARPCFFPAKTSGTRQRTTTPSTNSYFQYPTSSNTTPTASGPTALPNHANYQLAGRGQSNRRRRVHAERRAPTARSTWAATSFNGTKHSIVRLVSGLAGRFVRRRLGQTCPPRPRHRIRRHRGQHRRLPLPRGRYTPEPSSLVLAALGFIGLAAWRLRRR